MKKYLYLICLMQMGAFNVYAQNRNIDLRVDSLIKLMTLKEKIGQLNQYSGRDATGPATDKKKFLLDDIKNGMVGSVLNIKGVKDTREIQALALQSRLKIPLLFSLDVIHGYKTVFPVPLAESASWDTLAIRQSAHVAATEAAASGIHWTFAPMVDIGRDPRWGRVMEGAGEDAYLGSVIARARVLGFQGEKLGGTDAVMACAKHFAAYGAAIAGRDYNSVDMSDQMLNEVYLPPFKAAADAGVATFMNSFNTLNGIPATGNSYLQQDILKRDWAYKGFVVSDWGSINEMVTWGFAKNQTEAAKKAILAGNDMDMESLAYKNNLEKLVNLGEVKVEAVDNAVRRILYKKFELGLFDDPYKFSVQAREDKVMHDKSFALIARSVAEKSIVLLKNDKQILPLNNAPAKIALIGPLVKAKQDLGSTWTVYSDTTTYTSVYEGIRDKYGNKSKLSYARGCDISDTSSAGFNEALAVAKEADVVIMVLGEAGYMSGEAKSRSDICLPGRQEELFNLVKATGKKVIVVLMAGRPMIFNSIADKADAIIYAFWLGSETGNSLANVISGSYNPSGRLPITFPRAMGQIPVFYSYANTGRPVTEHSGIKYKSAYLDLPNTPRYAFGYGLSYTKFGYSDIKLDKPVLLGKDDLNISFTLTNTGSFSGSDVVQLYIQDKIASVVRPVKELKNFAKVMLKPGESKLVTFKIKPNQLSFYKSGTGWVTEPGAFKVMVGSSSDDIRLQGDFMVQ
ncbi:beta-glucosidase [Mucilaginibacter gracilis]|uniref:Beta-glucosidase n=1 Tax=Mucilaginibacter gracilis TaxID=423350 RepID=A0A495IZ26_9SPHI|nr:beta-glucosidase BglX [Mucilaginibacter gracilis]RKR81966.1 beta-glucosidase [Mucilaginibacter gracilis]